MHLAHGGMASTALDLFSILQPKRSAATPPVAGTNDQSNAFASQISGTGATDGASSGSAAGSPGAS